MFAVIYRWRLEPGAEEQFVDGWAQVIRARCGSYGARLHRGADGMWIAYARWPDAQSREQCEHGESEGSRLMREAVAEHFPDITMEITADLLAEPR